MIAIDTEDGEIFTVTIDGIAHTVHRNDLVSFLEHAQHLLDVTREIIIDPVEE